MTPERLAKEPQFVEKFLRATYRSIEDAQKNVAEAVAAEVEREPLLQRDMTEKQWRAMMELFYTDETKGCPHGWHSPKDWDTALATLSKHGGLEGDIKNHSKFYTNQFFACKR